MSPMAFISNSLVNVHASMDFLVIMDIYAIQLIYLADLMLAIGYKIITPISIFIIILLLLLILLNKMTYITH
jgi:hypothetical protein